MTGSTFPKTTAVLVKPCVAIASSVAGLVLVIFVVFRFPVQVLVCGSVQQARWDPRMGSLAAADPGRHLAVATESPRARVPPASAQVGVVDLMVEHAESRVDISGVLNGANA